MTNIYVIIIAIVLILSGVIGALLNNFPNVGDSIDEVDEISSTIISNIASLPVSTDLNFDSYNEYLSFTSKTNGLIEVLNEEVEWFDLKNFDTSENGYYKLQGFVSDVDSKVTEWGPLVGNYNEVINSAKEYQRKNTAKNKEKFHMATIRFGLETAIIGGAVFYKTSYKTVGSIYRASGLSRYAAKHPKLVSKILSIGHWEIRNGMVFVFSEILIRVEDKNYNIIETEDADFEQIVDNSWTKINKVKEPIGEQIGRGVEYLSEKTDEIKESEGYQKISKGLGNLFGKAKDIAKNISI